MGALDNVLGSVMQVYGAADANDPRVPAAVRQAYFDAKSWLTLKADSMGISTDAVAGAAGMAVTVASNVLSGHPELAAAATQQAILGTIAAFGGPVGMIGVGALQAIIAIGGTARGGGGECEKCSSQAEQWWGYWKLVGPGGAPGEVPPRNDKQPGWVHWDNRQPRTTLSYYDPGGKGHQWGVAFVSCDDSCPTVSGGSSCSAGHVTGQYPWLPAVLDGRFPKDGFDYALGLQIAHALELYINAAGPAPTLHGPGESWQLDLRSFGEKLLEGWNATHEPGRVFTIDPREHKDRARTLLSRHWPGDLLGYLVAVDGRTSFGGPLRVNTGALVAPLRKLLEKPPSRVIAYHPKARGRPAITTPLHIRAGRKRARRRWLTVAGGAVAGALLVGPWGAAVGAALGAWTARRT